MRIVTHNFMQCPRTKTYPLRLVPSELETVSAEYNGEFLERLLGRVDWAVLRQTAAELELGKLPEVAPKTEEHNEELFQLLHTVLLETHVKSGKLISQDGANTYEITNYIPNMLTTGTAAGSSGAAGSRPPADGDVKMES